MQTKDIVLIALFAALMAVLGIFPPINIPALGVPITAQSMGVMLAGALIGSKRGAVAIALFLVLVAVGLPLLSGGRGGFGVFLGPSGGFLLSFPLAAFLIGWLFERHGGAAPLPLALVYVILGGVVLVYAIGIPWVAVAAELPFAKAFFGSMAYVPGDTIKAVLTVFIAQGVRRAYPQI